METYRDILEHHGIKGQKWGVRRYQNEDGSLTKKGQRRYLKEMKKDMDSYFKGKISKEAGKVTNIGKNGYEQRGQSWNDAYRQKKVTKKDDLQIKSAARETREYMKAKYGESAFKALQTSGLLLTPRKNFEVKQEVSIGKERITPNIRNVKMSSITSQASGVVSGAPRTPQDSIRRHDEMMKGPRNMSQSEWLQRERKRQSKYNI